MLTIPGAQAADIYAGVPPPPPGQPAPAPEFDVLFGVAVTSDYISRGITQTNHKAAVQGHVEADYNIFYASLWASNVVGDTEIDLAAGLRPKFDKLSFDIGVVRYLYPKKTVVDYTDVYAKVNFAATDKLTLGGQVFVSPETSVVYGELNAAYALPYDFSVSGAFGGVTFNTAGLIPYSTWNLGLSYKWKNAITFDARYYDTNLTKAECGANVGAVTSNACDTRFVGKISFDTSMSTFKNLFH